MSVTHITGGDRRRASTMAVASARWSRRAWLVQQQDPHRPTAAQTRANLETPDSQKWIVILYDAHKLLGLGFALQPPAQGPQANGVAQPCYPAAGPLRPYPPLLVYGMYMSEPGSPNVAWSEALGRSDDDLSELHGQSQLGHHSVMAHTLKQQWAQRGWRHLEPFRSPGRAVRATGAAQHRRLYH